MQVYNNRMWEMFERGEIEKEHIYEERFRLYFAERGIEADTASFNRKYLYELAEGVNFMPHCAELLRVLHGRREGLHPDERRHLCAGAAN